MDRDKILAEEPDAVIVATGSLPRMDGIQNSNPGEPMSGYDLPNILSSISLLTEGRNWQCSSAVILDDTGHYEAIGVAEYLVGEGVDVTFVTPFTAFGHKVEDALQVEPALERMAKTDGKLKILTRHRIKSISENTVEIAPTYEAPTIEVAGELTVLVTPNMPMRSLYDELHDCIDMVTIVGDANSPRNLQKAIYEGHIAARNI
ncbi:hypothetical protein AB1K62_11350 [Parasphingorhabdus sp. JC815]|uniref:hypothetical protein n=1 Tax=Parasphingorhabdus sp. JC815 TaxID=3232140 RepID=UPI00345799D2